MSGVTLDNEDTVAVGDVYETVNRVTEYHLYPKETFRVSEIDTSSNDGEISIELNRKRSDVTIPQDVFYELIQNSDIDPV